MTWFWIQTPVRSTISKRTDQRSAGERPWLRSFGARRRVVFEGAPLSITIAGTSDRCLCGALGFGRPVGNGVGIQGRRRFRSSCGVRRGRMPRVRRVQRAVCGGGARRCDASGLQRPVWRRQRHNQQRRRVITRTAVTGGHEVQEGIDQHTVCSDHCHENLGSRRKVALRRSAVGGGWQCDQPGHRKRGNGAPLSSETSEKLLRVARIRNLGRLLFSTDEAVWEWLSKRHTALGNMASRSVVLFTGDQANLRRSDG
jgi:hypothetical protein